MITARSALLDRKTRRAIVHDPVRAQVVARLRDAGITERDIAFALNCSQSIVTRYVVADVPRGRRVAADTSQKINQPPDQRPIPRSASVLLRYRPPQTQKGIAGERERLAQHRAQEILSWISSIELNDGQGLQVIERAGLLLNTSPLKANGEYLFDKNRALSDLLGIWSPKALSAGDRDFETLLSRWLASWIRFWIAQPIVCERALDIAFAHFEAQAQAA
jgi:hypothetical protein